ncbi:Methyltransferase domain-containing protein [Pseudosulfitobacter pseudonitzschiae]|uniref:SAM-dependent methyltransferase n=1 Tax=Pseudosulfitobacter pseudonitzschiae TaxID=1402135 RepID=A0A073JGY1_9RHOB|nr:methyltransferase domain-containing protein [Pseudosulfitobacter pseudonitzschiae]KEJ96977.1 SAM-dependent methyltransferase [Pseudosulfitobacter pseudonitzschiae]QKS07103.1 methyltransferase domain-containing protein [Pseudosulfitobacter pseudonitzschiae]SHF48213.1 Methyltransferase domain-containing protein [Pseudosulfitobacter pseudonitzschiae]
MNTHAPLTDTSALAAHRKRVRADAMFLHQTAREEIQDRLELVNRTFTQAAVVTGFPEMWRNLILGARIVSEGETLDLQPGTQDLVIHAMGLHWSNDPVGQLIQCQRALKPDGLFLGVCFGGQTLHELRACLAEAEVAQTGGLSPRIAPMGEVRDLGALLQRAGFALPVADVLTQRVEYKSPLHLMHDLRAMGETNALTGRLRKPTRKAVMMDAVARYQSAFGTDTGRIRTTFDLVFLAGWAPDPSQPKALRPGSAQQRLADALNVAERPLPD